MTSCLCWCSDLLVDVFPTLLRDHFKSLISSHSCFHRVSILAFYLTVWWDNRRSGRDLGTKWNVQECVFLIFSLRLFLYQWPNKDREVAHLYLQLFPRNFIQCFREHAASALFLVHEVRMAYKDCLFIYLSILDAVIIKSQQIVQRY